MRRIICFVLIVLILSQGVFAFSQGRDAELVKVNKHQEITDFDTLVKKAKETGEETSLKLKNTKNGEVNPIPAYSFTQLIEEEIYSDGTTKEYYTTFTFADVDADFFADDISILNESGYNYKEKWDDSIGVKATSKIYYKIVTYNGESYAEITKFEVSWYVSDTQLEVISRSVHQAQKGRGMDGKYKYQERYLYPASNTLRTYYTPSTWVPVNIDIIMHVVGVRTECTIQRKPFYPGSPPGSTWTLVLINTLSQW